MLKNLIKDLNIIANPNKAKILASFFKTGKGEYGEGDIFLGITVPKQREITKKYLDLDWVHLGKLLNSKFHEYRLTALIILVDQYEIARKNKDEKLKKEIIDFYLKNVRRSRVNNWDLVDLSAPKILGSYLLDKKKDLLYDLARSKNLWERRVAILSTFAFIRKNNFRDALKISKILISDTDDLIQKAVGWMLREGGKKNLIMEEKFLDKYAKIMPRVMLRYAIERFNKEDRLRYLRK